MYRNFFGMNDSPFGTCPDPRFLYMTPQIQEALACLQYGIAARKGFVVMTGEVGTGKTTLLKTALSSFADQRIATAFVFNPRLDVLDFLEFVLADFCIPSTKRTKSGMLLQLNSWLIDRFGNGELCAIVVDDAQNLSWELLEEIRLLTNLENCFGETRADCTVRAARTRTKAAQPQSSPASSAHFTVVQDAAADQRGDRSLYRKKTSNRWSAATGIFARSCATCPWLFQGDSSPHQFGLRACTDQRIRGADQACTCAHR